ncbi:hypothetical protein BISA_0904 [Bifidobacterium saguini DSM 23967]|uniref:Uncharacterized protein n=2 Tax=Bifidobacterium saguini TaxID=762210 RepID=A0A087DAF2_9BIFI|nr:hypothetical protein BISA_0904 [Bifidobacterium saguini DSM 23967]
MNTQDRQGYRWGVVIAGIAVLVVVMLCVVANRPADTSHVQYTYSASSKFSKAQLDAAGKTVTRSFSGFTGCTLNKVSYDESTADKFLDWEYDENDRERMFVATVDFTCDGSDMSLSKGPQSMSWYLRLNDDGKTWKEIDHGNG